MEIEGEVGSGKQPNGQASIYLIYRCGLLKGLKAATFSSPVS